MDDKRTAEDILEHFDEYENLLKELLELHGQNVNEGKSL